MGSKGNIIVVIIIWAGFFGSFGFFSGLGRFFFLDFFCLLRTRESGWIVELGLVVIIFIVIIEI